MASLGGFGAVTGTGALSGGTTSPGRYFADTVNTVTTSGSFETFDVYMDSVTGGETLKVKIWRVNGSNYDFVGETQAVASATLSAGLNSAIAVDTPFDVQAGDLIAVFLSNAGAGFDIESTSGGATKFKVGDHTTTQTIASYSDTGGQPSIEIFGTPAAIDTITITEKGTGSVEQRTIATSNASVTISGNYGGDTFGNIEVRILDASDDTTEISTWETLEVAPTGNTFSGTVTVPQGGWYHAEVRWSGSTGITDLHAQDWGVGILLALWGQSNLENWFTDGTGTPNALLSEYNGSWSKKSGTGAGANTFGNAITAAFPGIPVGLVNSTLGNTQLTGGVDWGDDTLSVYSDALADATNVGNKFEGLLWMQGENDYGQSVSAETYSTAEQLLITSRSRTILTNASTRPNLPIFVGQIGRRTDRPDVDVQAIRTAKKTDIAALSDVYYAAEMYDLALSDTVHLTPADYITHATRFALAVVDVLGSGTYHRGPRIAKATLTDSVTIDLPLLYDGGSDFTPASGITGFEVFDDAVAATVSSVVRLNASTVRITVSAPLVGEATVRYMYGANPDITAVLKDNTTETLPLEMNGDLIVAAAPSVATSRSRLLVETVQRGFYI